MDTRQGWCGMVLAIFYGGAGLLHIALPTPFVTIVPLWVQDPSDVVLFTGCCEIAGAAGLLIPKVRRYAGLGLALYAICVFPANIKHATDSLTAGAVSPWQWLYHGVRLPLQPVFVWAALFAGGITRWPLRTRG